MSSCAASCSTCCHAASCASATSDSSPTGNALRCCRSASSCSPVQPTARIELRRPLRIILARLPTGTVPSAEALCTSWNGSPQLNSGCVLHPSPTYVPHETAIPTSISPHASACTPPLRLKEPWHQQNHPNRHLRPPQNHAYPHSSEVRTTHYYPHGTGGTPPPEPRTPSLPIHTSRCSPIENT